MNDMVKWLKTLTFLPPQVLAVSVTNRDRVLVFAPACPPPGSTVLIYGRPGAYVGEGPSPEMVLIQRRQIIDEATADDVVRGIEGTTPEYWAIGTPWIVVSQPSDHVSSDSAGTSTSA